MSAPPPFPSEYEIAFGGLVVLSLVLYSGVVYGRDDAPRLVRMGVAIVLLSAVSFLLFSLFVRFS